jgi:hypothetical protein
MEAPSLPHFKLGPTFFGFKPEDRPRLHENIFNLLWYADGRLSWDDIYQMPIFLRNYYVKRVNKMIQAETDAAEERMREAEKRNKVKVPQKPR